MKVEKCHVCGSKAIIPDIEVRDRNENYSQNLSVRLFRKPNAIIFKEAHEAEVKAWICGDCGHVEMFFDNPTQMYEAWLAQQMNS